MFIYQDTKYEWQAPICRFNRRHSVLSPVNFDVRAFWLADDLRRDASWIYQLNEAEQHKLLIAVRRTHSVDKLLLDYTQDDFNLTGALGTLTHAFAEVRDGRGIAIVKGLPRESMSEAEFELMTWAIGLHFGVARPQGKASQYLSPVKNVGTVYRSATGRGYSSNAELDFHTDGADIVGLTCYNAARSGGDSYCSSSVAALKVIADERPDLIPVLFEGFPFSRQGEQAEGEDPYITAPVFGIEGGRVFCKWVRNRLESAVSALQAPITPSQREAVDYLDEVVRRDALKFTMRLEPGDLQLLNTHVTLHSRSEFEDYEDETRKRTLFRMWLAPPDSFRLPEGWRAQYGAVEAGAIRGGIRGQHYTQRCVDFEIRQAKALGMRPPSVGVTSGTPGVPE
jgi:hypothetical protein